MIARREVRKVGPWLIERLLTALALAGLLGAVLLVGLMLTWAGGR